MIKASLIALVLVIQPVAVSAVTAEPAVAVAASSTQAQVSTIQAQPAKEAKKAPVRKHATPPRPFGSGSQVTLRYSGEHTYSVKLPSTAKRAALQKKVGKAWKHSRSVNLVKLRSGLRGDFTVTAPKPGKTEAYRLYIHPTSTRAATTSATQKLHSPLRSTWLHVWSVSKDIVASNHQAEISGIVDNSWRPVKLQRLYKGKWLTVASKKTNRRGDFSFKTPKSQATTKYKYRVYAPQHNGYDKAVSKAVIFNHENPRHYKGYRKKIYNHMKKWCPDTLVRTAKPNKKWSGLAHMGRNTVTLVTGMSGKRLKHVALHECAHMRQDRVYKNQYAALEKRMNKIYKTKGTRGLENNADCIARAMGSPGPFSYTSNCKGYRGTAAKHILKGKRP